MLMKHRPDLRWSRFLLCSLAGLALCLGGCPARGLSLADPVIDASRLSLHASSPDPLRIPLYDRVDLVQLANPAGVDGEYPSNGEFFAAIERAGGRYLGGDYLGDDERSSGRAVYELELPASGQYTEKLPAWLICLELQGTSVIVRRRIPLENWPLNP
jgi:hypothetical protein